MWPNAYSTSSAFIVARRRRRHPPLYLLSTTVVCRYVKNPQLRILRYIRSFLPQHLSAV